ncbi:MAG TPA: hypothetical protein VGB92_12400 [Longimicrobium sp.]|jgi:hypothetical protein
MRDIVVRLARLLGFGFLCWLALHLVAAYRYPFAGGEFHAIFAYPRGTFDVARGVFLTYLITTAFFTSLGVLLLSRSAWWGIALVASAVCLEAWWQVCSFEYSIPAIRGPAMRLLPVIPLVVFAVASLTHWTRSRAVRGRPGERRATAA